MRRSESLGPLRVQNGDPSRQSVGKGKRSSSGNRLSRSSSEGRCSTGIPSLTGRPGRPSTGRTSTGYAASMGRAATGRPSTGRQSSAMPSYGGSGAGIRTVSRLSSIGQKNPRHSSIGGRGRSTIPKECRPISDKTFQQKCIRRLYEFLVEEGYPCSISVKTLQSPTNKDFIKIFEFIYSFLVPDIKLNAEDIPRYFKQLGYPVAITKSSMYSVGSPHTWPGILAALVWLMELVQFIVQNQESGDDRYLFTCDDDFDSMSEDKMLYLYVEKTYQAYLSGEDEFGPYDQTLSRAIKAKYCGGSTATDPLSDINRLQQELELLEKDSGLLRALQEEKHFLESDSQRMTDYLNKLESFKKTLQHQASEVSEEMSVLTGKKDSLCQKYDNMEIICEQQVMTQADIQRIRLKRRDLQNQIDSLEKESESLDKDIWKLETDVAKSREKIEGISRDYNSQAHCLKLIPSTAENALGVDFEMKTSHYNTMTDDLESLKVNLLEFKKRCSASVRGEESEKLKQQNMLEMLRETVNEAKEDNKSFEKKISKKEEEIDMIKKMNHREIEMIEEEIESEQNLILDLQKECHVGTQEHLKDLRETQKQCEQKYLELEKIERIAVNTLNELVNDVVQNKTNQQVELQNYVDYSQSIFEKLEKEDLEM